MATKAELMADVVNMAKAMGVPPVIALGIVQTESTWDPNAVSKKGAIGLMQVMPNIGQAYAAAYGLDITSADLYNPTLNIWLGLTILVDYWRKFTNPWNAVSAYNIGETAFRRGLAKMLSSRQYVNKDYVDKVWQYGNQIAGMIP